MYLIPEDTRKNLTTFTDCLAAALATKLAPPSKPRRRRRRKSPSPPVPAPAPVPADPASEAGDEAGDLAEFTEYIASETFAALPPDLQSLTHTTWTQSHSETYPLPLSPQTTSSLLRTLDPAIPDSLETYTTHPAPDFLAPVLTAYLETFARPPPAPRSTKADAEGCELCGRDWVRLTYHHLVPRSVHEKAVRRGWHRREDLENVAWLCHACHGFVHRSWSNEELARGYFTVERLLVEEKVRAWVGWVGGLKGGKA